MQGSERRKVLKGENENWGIQQRKCKVWMRINVSTNRKRLPFRTKGTDDLTLLHGSKKRE